MRGRKGKWIAAVTALLVAAAGCSPRTDGAAGRFGQAQRAVPVEVKKVAKEEFALRLSLSGRVEANQQVDQVTKASGRIKEIFVHVGDQVKAGQPIAAIDSDEVRIQVQRSQAALLSAQSRYEEAKEGTPKESVIQTQNVLAELKSSYDQAKTNLERQEALYREGAVSAEDVEKARQQLISASTSLENQKQKLKLDEKGPTAASLNAAAAQVKQAQADLALAQYNLQNLTVKAPIDGVVGDVPVTVGQTVNNGTVVAQILNIAKMKVQVQATESQVGLFSPGQSVDVNIPSIQLKTTGKVVSVSPLANSNKAYPIEIEISNPGLQIKTGMIASVEVKAKPRQSLVVPREAVISQDQNNYVYINENGKAKQVKVQVGESDGQRIEILGGLNGGEEVIVAGQNMLVPDAPVVVIDPNHPANKPAEGQGTQEKRNRYGGQKG